MPASSLFEDWTKEPEHPYPATSLIQHLITLVAADVCTFRQNTQTSYRFVDIARTIYDQINLLIKRVDESGNWADFETYTAAIDPLEEALIKFQLEAELLEQKHYLNDSTSVTDCCAFVNRTHRVFREVAEGVDLLKGQLSQVPSQPRPEHSNALAIKSVMTIYGFMQLGLSDTVPVEAKLYLKAEKVWLEAQQQGQKTYDAVNPIFVAFFDQLSNLAAVGLPTSYRTLLQIVGTIGRAYHAQSIQLVKLCHQAAMHYQASQNKNDKQYVALENALDQTLEDLQKVIKDMKFNEPGIGLSCITAFNDTTYEKHPFTESINELKACFGELKLDGAENGEALLKTAMEADKNRMLAAKLRLSKATNSLEIDESKMVEVLVKVRKSGQDIGEHKIRAQRSARLAAIGWSAARDASLKEKLMGQDFKFEQESTGTPGTNKTISTDSIVGSLTTNTTLTLLMVI
ncbi:hypothetical protein RhiLY_13273 [Ceratobasidium sp. AG-Ba]|nr:hypothetical protein RhiLY_13273 [Ceratobasidium sp. AG-Ba]